jgi:hypothetical protein
VIVQFLQKFVVENKYFVLITYSRQRNFSAIPGLSPLLVTGLQRNNVKPTLHDLVLPMSGRAISNLKAITSGKRLKDTMLLISTSNFL